MIASRTFVSPIARAAFRPQTVRVPANNRFTSIRARIATMSTISNTIIKYHRELEKCYDEVVNNPDDINHITQYGNQFTWELARHSVAEELLIYPAFEKYMGKDGHEKAEHDRKEHHRVSDTLPNVFLV